MFDVDAFLDRCRDARAEHEPRLALRDVLARTVADGSAVAETMAPREAGITVLSRDQEMTILHVVWAPGMSVNAHDHRMWAAIGIYTGREDNDFYRRVMPGAASLEAAGGRRIDDGDTLLLGDEIIHRVSNPGRKLTGAFHVYGGDLVAQPRSQWGPALDDEQPYDMEAAGRLFAAANESWRTSTDPS